MSRYLFHPKALPVSNIFEDWKTEMRRRNIHAVERQAVSPAAPFNTPVPGYAMAVALGFTICAGAFSLAFAIYWILRIFL